MGRSFWSAGVALMILAVPFIPGSPAADEGEGKKISRKVEVDRERGEVRIHAWFVQPTRVLEVFACHESGPVWETVLAFDAGGEEIYEALRAVGFRGPEYWNLGSGNDLRLVGGDRAVIWLRWEVGRQVREIPAEDILLAEGTGEPLFVRGFSFAAKRVLLGDPPKLAIPTAVEFTIGGTSRQGAVFSMLYHANDLAEMVNWLPAPEVNMKMIPETSLGAKAPCTLIIRRLKREQDLVELALRLESSPERRAVREIQRPIAIRIDSLKGQFREATEKIRATLEVHESRTDMSEGERILIFRRTRTEVAHRNRLAHEIREQYLRLWDCEENHKYRKLKNDPHLDSDRKAWVEMAYRNGFRFELAIAEKRREIAALAEDDAGGSVEQRGLLQKALLKEIEVIQQERERRWGKFRLEVETRPKLKSLDPREDVYLIRLFREQELRDLASMRKFRAEVESGWTEARRLRAQAKGTLEGIRGEIEKSQKQAESIMILAKAELYRVELMEKIRWAEHEDSGDRITRLRKDLEQTLEKVKDLRAAVERETGKPAGAGDEAPEDAQGKPLFPEGYP